MKRTPEEVANTIEDFVNGKGNQWTWDDFTSIRLNSPELDEIRKKVVAIPVEFPPANLHDYCSPAGLEKMRQMVQELRAHSKA